jgi:Peptidase A4 family
MHRRLPWLMSMLAGGAVLGLAVAVAPAAGASTAAPATLHARAAAAAVAAIRHLSVGEHAANHAVRGHAVAIKGLTQEESTNWSGYADNNSAGNAYSTVTGNWTEPTVTCSGRSESLAAFWVGIDGLTSDSVEQDGTLAECYFGSAYYYTWWEMYPTNDIQVVGESLRPGDSISASVVRSGSSYTLKVTDSSRSGDSFTTTQSCSSCANSSAEWIAEAPSSSTGVLPLSDFHSWTLSGATVTSGSAGVISSFPDDELTMVDSSGAVKAQPGPLNSSGNGFSVTWERSS